MLSVSRPRKLESVKQELQDSLDECRVMKVNGMHDDAWAEKFKRRTP